MKSSRFCLPVWRSLRLRPASPAYAQQAGPPPAVLVQPAELRSMTKQAEFVGHAEALEKVDLRARVQGFLGPRLFKDGDDGQREPGGLHDREGAVRSRGRPAQGPARRGRGDARECRTAIAAHRRARPARAMPRLPSSINERPSRARPRPPSWRPRRTCATRRSSSPIPRSSRRSAGRIGRPSVSPGNLVGPDTGVLATVVKDDPMQVLFSVTQREMLEARDFEVTGKVRARVRLANGSLYSEKGRIDFLDVQVNPRTDGQTVRAMFPNPDDILTSGQTVRVIIEEKGGDKVVVIPQSAVAIDQTGSYVFVVGQDNKVEQRRVRLGATARGSPSSRRAWSRATGSWSRASSASERA